MGLPSEIDLGIDDVLNHLDITVMGVIEARYKRFGVTADLFYVNISASPSTPLNLLFDRVDLDQKEFVGNFVAFYRAVDQRGRSDPFAA